MAETAAEKRQRELDELLEGYDRQLESYAHRLQKLEEKFEKLRTAIIARGGFPVD